ncbi:MAG TPA: DoxX family protein [Terriglobales bacterium]|jgi:uncharacterized membrane protein YphA (DoxX/SURF4 family)|nr:DoxX family protein [Terriglobales bacterium]
MPNRASSITVAAVRIATGVFFLFFAEYKLADSVFANTTFPDQWLQQFISGGAVSFYAGFLQKVVLPHHILFGYLVGILELFIGISLILGFWVRAASVLGVLHMLSLTFATWWEPGHNLPKWRYFGNELDHLPLLFLFLIFFSANAGCTWGLDGVLRRRKLQRTSFLREE